MKPIKKYLTYTFATIGVVLTALIGYSLYKWNTKYSNPIMDDAVKVGEVYIDKWSAPMMIYRLAKSDSFEPVILLRRVRDEGLEMGYANYQGYDELVSYKVIPDTIRLVLTNTEQPHKVDTFHLRLR